MNGITAAQTRAQADRRTRGRRYAVVAVAVIVGLTITGCGDPNTSVSPRAESAEQTGSVGEATDPVTTDSDTSTSPAPTVAESTVPLATPQPTTIPPATVAPTTIPPTTTTLDPTIRDGTYIVGTDIQPGMYRVAGYWARLDEAMEIIDNDGVYEDGFGMLNVRDTDAYVEISGAAVPFAATRALDPSVEGFSGGTYLVNWDIQPGRYRISDPGGMSYFARLDADGEIIDNNISEGAVLVIVAATDWALSISGVITPA